MTEVSRNWDEFHATDISQKAPFFSREGRLYDCLFSQQFDRKLLDHLFTVADRLRQVTGTPEGAAAVARLLAHKRAMLYFVQPSTRTFLSFLNACHILGLKTSEIRDTTTSSEIKGESPEDTVRTFSSYVDIIIMRHPAPGFVEKTAWVMNRAKRPVPVVNGGSGKDQHPTQALLDVYTLHRSLPGGVDDKRLVMVGDLKRGRTVRSLSYLMKNYRGVSLTFVSPPELRMEADILEFLRRHDIPYQETEDFASAMIGADAIYMTRIQDEHDVRGESRGVDYAKFHFKAEHLKVIKPSAIIMHPLPRRHEIELSVDEDDRAVYWRQERNGMWARAALIAYIFGVDGDIPEPGR
ncbi:MAG TPA: aspartate carbamoyltransferase [Elusimicrobia bacterium]|nr:aspartate carbamoyltransferase [Elusimicrobiota bacterium]HBT61301.1 aspartate carbamoyltransferase [Elusimicrobiota bacterium]